MDSLTPRNTRGPWTATRVAVLSALALLGATVAPRPVTAQPTAATVPASPRPLPLERDYDEVPAHPRALLLMDYDGGVSRAVVLPSLPIEREYDAALRSGRGSRRPARASSTPSHAAFPVVVLDYDGRPAPQVTAFRLRVARNYDEPASVATGPVLLEWDGSVVPADRARVLPRVLIDYDGAAATPREVQLPPVEISP